MKGIGKSLRFYCDSIFQGFIRTLVFVAVFSAVMISMEGGDYKEASSNIVPLYLIIMVVLMNFITAMNCVSVIMPMTVSFGSTRKSSFWGMVISEHLFNIAFLAVVYVCCYFISGDWFNSFLMPFVLSVVGYLVIMISLGNLVGVISLKYGKTKGAVIYVIFILAVVFGAMIFGMSGVYGWFAEGGVLDSILKGPWILIVGIVTDVVISWFSYFAIRKSDLQIG